VDERRLDLLSDVVEKFWPESIAVADLRNTQLLAEIERARTAVLEALKMVELSG
jgi:succinylarginine dihydrolase